MKNIFRHISLLAVVAALMLTACKPAETLSSNSGKKNGKDGEQASLTSKTELKIDYLFVEANTYEMQGKYREALGLYKQILEIDPDHHASLYNIAKISMELNSYEDAVKYGERACKLDESNIWYYRLLKDAYMASRDYEKAIGVQEQIAKKFDEDPRAQFDLGEIYTQQAQFEKAIEVYEGIEAEMGPSEELLLKKQQLYIYLDQIGKAIAEVDKLIELDPTEDRYFLTKYELYVLNNDFDGAKKCLDEMLTLFPNNGFALLAMAEYYENKGEQSKAREYLKKAFSSRSITLEEKVQVMGSLYQSMGNNPNGIQELKSLTDQLVKEYPREAMVYGIKADLFNAEENYDSSRYYYRKSIELDATNEQVWQELLFLDSREQDFVKMNNDADEALELVPNNSLFLYFKGVAAQQLKETDEAKWAFNKILKQGTSDLEILMQTYFSMAEIFKDEGEYAKSDEMFEEVLEMNPANHLAMNNYAYYLSLRNEKLDYASQMVQKALEYQPNSSPYLDTYGWILYQQGDYKKAAEWIKKSIDHGGDGEVFEHYGDALIKLGKREEAIAYWEKAIATGQKELIIEDKLNTSKLNE